MAAKGAPELTGLALMLSEISTPRAETGREAGGGEGMSTGDVCHI